MQTLSAVSSLTPDLQGVELACIMLVRPSRSDRSISFLAGGIAGRTRGSSRLDLSVVAHDLPHGRTAYVKSIYYSTT